MASLRPSALDTGFAIVCSIGTFTVAGGFSSRLSTAGEVLLQGSNCAVPKAGVFNNFTLENLARSDASIFTNSMASYAQQCYSTEKSGFLECSRFITSTIPTAAVDYNAPCPFSRDLCRRNNSSIRLDTGHLNSNDIFGLNSNQEETLTFRYVLQCSPLVTEGRTHNTTISDLKFIAYDFGPWHTSDIGKYVNYTFLAPDLDVQYAAMRSGVLNEFSFDLRYVPISCIYLIYISFLWDLAFGLTNNSSPRHFRMFQGSLLSSSSQFIPDPNIVKHDGDVTLVFLSGNGVTFISPEDDDWYRPTVRYGSVTSSDANRRNVTQDRYRPEEAASLLGCTQQFQWCRDPAKGQCGNLEGRLDALYSAAQWFNLTTKDLDPDRPVPKTKLGSLLMWAYFILVDDTTSLQGFISSLGPRSLASQNSVRQGMVSGLQKNQWQLDVKQWWQILLAGFQARFVNTAQGSDILPNRPYTFKPASEYDWGFCRNQKIRSAQHASFSIFGLVFTYSMGALIVLISFAIAPILSLLQKRGWYNKYAYIEWEGHTAIQLHRVAQDQLGHGRWGHCDESIPITQQGDLLAPFDVSDPSHPMLARDFDGTSPEKEEPESTSQVSSDGRTSHRSSIEHDYDGSCGNTSAGARGVFLNVHTGALGGSWFHGLDGDLERCETRTETGP
ncbi:uncharacterized protein PG986_002889 [Apiospora aurea]|uniref:Uncharacterized protein n=1 Tax=Apiospora aurea TaxID=335848 RepID=A0ABR1QQ42_9PEZI